MWRWILVNLLVFSFTATQPISDHDRPTECCPCPKAADMGMGASSRSSFVEDYPYRSSVRFSNPGGSFARHGDTDQTLAGTTRDGAFIGAGGVDDCPCRIRDADAEGAPSFFLPTAVRALWNGVSDKEKKEDGKPLLHPEVGLASSVLETLRQATDEEYQEALARDAVRSVLQTPDVDVISDVSSALDTARSLVNVLLKPDDVNDRDSDTGASHVQESRCIHPLGRSKGLNLQYSPTSAKEVIGTAKKEPVTLFHKNRNWDMDSNVGASNVHEQIIDGTGKGLGLKLKSNPPLINLFPAKNNDGTIQRIKPLQDQKPWSIDAKGAEPDSSLNTFNEQINNHLLGLKQKIDDHFQTIHKDNTDKLKNVLDTVNSASVPNLVYKPLLPTATLDLTTIKPFPLKSLLKLKDVELVPPIRTLNSDLNRARVNVPELTLSKNNNVGSNIDLLKDFKNTDLSKLITNGLKINFENRNVQGGIDNVQPIRKRLFKSGIVDAETSPSNVNVNVNQDSKNSENCDVAIDDNDLNSKKFNLPEAKAVEILEKLPSKINKPINNIPVSSVECIDESINNNINDLSKNVDKISNTEIIDTVPSPSEIQPIEQTDEDVVTNQEDFNNTPHNDVECEVAVNTEETNENTFDGDSKEKNRDINNNDAGMDEADINEINVPEDVEERDEQFEENCLNEHDSMPATSIISPTVVAKDNSNTHGSNSNEDCIDESTNDKLNLDTQATSQEFKDTPSKENNPLHGITSIKENILNKLDKFKKPMNIVSVDGNKDTVTNFKNNNVMPVTEECQEYNINTKENSEPPNPSEPLDFQDLQNMSDKLLELETKNDQETFASEKIECELPKNNQDSNKIQNPSDDIESDEVSETSRNINTPQGVDNAPDASYIIENISESNKNTLPKISCASELDENSNADFKNDNEMTADGSDHNIDTIVPESEVKPSCLHDILHPKALNIGSNLRNPHLGNILKVPSLEDVRENLANGFTTKKERITDDSNTMAADASAPTLKSILPSLQPLEDIDLDIFQLKPLTLADPQELLSNLPSLPRLNLNSYKTKLAVPKGLNLKPMKLESSFGGKNGLLGAILTIGSGKTPFGKGSSVLKSPLGLDNLPTLEELHSNMRENAQNLLITPLDITGRNIIDDSLRSSQTLTDNIRSHAKNTMKDIQQTLETTLNDVKQSDLGILANPLKDPQEFVQAMSRTHEDVTDKLKAIHYDFNDRLESLRDRISDQSLLPALNSPLMRQSSLKFGPEKIKEQSTFLSTSFSKPQKKIKTLNKSKSQSSSRVSSSRTKPIKTKTFKMPASPSIPVPRTVEAPKLKAIATASPPPLVWKHPSFRTPQFLSNKKGIPNIFQEPVSRFRDSKIPIFGKYKPAENKITISFGSTTLKPDLFRSEPSLASRPIDSRRRKLPTRPTSSIKSGTSRIGSKIRPVDANSAPSVLAPSKLTAPENIRDIQKDLPTIAPKKTTRVIKTKILNKPKLLNDEVDRFTNGHAGKQFSAVDKSAIESESFPNSRLLGAPKNSDILSSLREAVRARMSKLTPISNDRIVQPDSSFQPDMLRSASENIESTNDDGLMRENASYTCRMMCTRNN